MPRPADVTGHGTPDLTAQDLAALGERVSAARAAVEARGETFYQGASRIHLGAFPPRERWDDWVELSSRAWPAREEHHYMLVPTTGFNAESRGGGNGSPGLRRCTPSPRASVRRRRRDGTTRSWCTWAAPARTATPSGSWPAGEWTGTTRTPTCAQAAGGPDSSSGWAWTGPVPTTPTRRSST